MCGSPWEHDGLVLAKNILDGPDGSVSLTPSEAVVVRMLLERPATVEELIRGLYAGTDGGPLTARTVLMVHLYNLRKKLPAVGYSIFNIKRPHAWHDAYTISALDKGAQVA